jgi:hypothetical protein
LELQQSLKYCEDDLKIVQQKKRRLRKLTNKHKNEIASHLSTLSIPQTSVQNNISSSRLF